MWSKANASALCSVSQSAAIAQETASPTAVHSNQGNIHELKRTFQALEIDLQAQRNRVSLSWDNPESGDVSVRR